MESVAKVNTPKQAYATNLVAKNVAKSMNNLNAIAMESIYRNIFYSLYMEAYQKLLFS